MKPILPDSLDTKKKEGKPVKSIKFFTLGCKANQYDTQSIRERFLKNGFQEPEQGKAPDYFLINTCTVTAAADQKSRNIIRKCIRSSFKSKVIVTGCAVEKDRRVLSGIQGLAFIIGKSFFPEGVSNFSQRTRAFLKIQDGCSNFCAYCKVALVRGRERSKDIAQAVIEAKKLAGCGYKEIVLTGICLGAYGRDLRPKKNIISLLKELEKIEGLDRIRLSSIEARDVTSGLIRFLAQSSKFCRHLHIPVQSGDNRILKLMNRKYTRQKYQDLAAGLRRSIPGISITTDCLVGFPGETDENFENTVDLVREIMPLKAHIFPYSLRPGTKAAGFTETVSPKIINLRCQRLKEVAENCRINFMRGFVSKKTAVLIEGRAKDNPEFLEGLTDNYLPVRLPFRPNLKNRIVNARIERIFKGNLIGEYIDNL